MQIRLARICIEFQWPARQVVRPRQVFRRDKIFLMALTVQLELIVLVE